jgi:Glucose-6-phosphate dehydrogenase, NAD binding domain
VDQLGKAKLTDQDEGEDGKHRFWRRVVIEKPFGHSLDSPRRIPRPDPCAIVIFGATGDLTKLGHRNSDGFADRPVVTSFTPRFGTGERPPWALSCLDGAR